jgi:hypothetical protein
MSPRPPKFSVLIQHRRDARCATAETVTWEDSRHPDLYWCATCFRPPPTARPFYLSATDRLGLNHTATTAAPAQEENAA